MWVELATYVGVIGGSSGDYLAYVSYLRDKQWGRAGMRVTPSAELDSFSPEARRATWQWLRAPLIDCTLSFLAVLIFMAVFVALGTAVLGPQHKVLGRDEFVIASGGVRDGRPSVAEIHLFLRDRGAGHLLRNH